MTVKIYISDNYLNLEFDTGRVYSASAHEAVFQEVNSGAGEEAYKLEGVPGLEHQVFKLADLIDENDAAYTLTNWRNFYKTKTGKGTSITTLTQTEYDALTEAQKTDGTTYLIA
jgi:hypothetical protein